MGYHFPKPTPNIFSSVCVETYGPATVPFQKPLRPPLAVGIPQSRTSSMKSCERPRIRLLANCFRSNRIGISSISTIRSRKALRLAHRGDCRSWDVPAGGKLFEIVKTLVSRRLVWRRRTSCPASGPSPCSSATSDSSFILFALIAFAKPTHHEHNNNRRRDSGKRGLKLLLKRPRRAVWEKQDETPHMFSVIFGLKHRSSAGNHA